MSKVTTPGQYDVAVVGGGIAGAAAASAAAGTGAVALLLGDDLSKVAKLPSGLHQRRGNVWGCFAGLTLAVANAERNSTIRSRSVIVATGSHEPEQGGDRQAESGLARMAGAKVGFQPGSGGWVPVLDGSRMSSVPGLFVAGDAAGPCSADVASLEGRLAGLAAAAHVGKDVGAALVEARRALEETDSSRLQPQHSGGGALDGALGDAAIICRCEDVDRDAITSAVQLGATTINDVKRRTKAGMGECQGRDCTSAIGQLLHQLAHVPVDAIEAMTSRPPIRPIAVGQLAALDADTSSL